MIKEASNLKKNRAKFKNCSFVLLLSTTHFVLSEKYVRVEAARLKAMKDLRNCVLILQEASTSLIICVYTKIIIVIIECYIID